MPNTDPGHRPRRRGARGAGPRPATPLCDVARRRRHHRGPGGRAARPDGRDGRPRRAPLHRRRQRRRRTTASCAGPWSTPAGCPGRHPGPALRGRGALAGGHMHEGEWSSRLGIPGQPGRGRGADGRCATWPWPGSPAPGSTSSTCPPPARSSWSAQAKADGLPGHGRGDPPPLHPHRRRGAPATTRCSRSTRRCAPTPTWPRSRPAWPTAPSTPSPPTTPPTPRRPRSALRPGAARDARAWRRRWPSPSPSSTCRSSRSWPLLSWQPAAIAGLDDEHGGPVAAGRPANLCVIDPDRHVDRRPRRLGQPQPATRPTPAARSPAGSATPCSAASPSSSTGRPNDEPRTPFRYTAVSPTQGVPRTTGGPR